MGLSRLAADLLDYLHRCGGTGERAALVDYAVEVEGYSGSMADRALDELLRDGAIDGQRGGGGRSSLYTIDYDSEFYSPDGLSDWG